MKFIIVFEDNPDADPGLRARHMQAHLAFLEAHMGSILAAGPLFDGSGKGRGGLWLVEAGAAEEVGRLVHEDPFWPTGLRKSFDILEWRQVYAEGQRLILPK